MDRNKTRMSQPRAPKQPASSVFLDIRALKTPIFGPLSLQLSAGECIAIRGKSGAGKSIFLRAIADLDPNEGDVVLDGESRAAMAANQWRRKVMLLPAESGWWADRVGEHFENPEAAANLLDALSLNGEALSWQVRRLSTGERQRLAIARALALQPKVLLMDEPTAALDPQATEKVEAIMRQQMAKGVGIILITHDQQQGRRMGVRRFLLEDGKLVIDEAGQAAGESIQ